MTKEAAKRLAVGMANEAGKSCLIFPIEVSGGMDWQVGFALPDHAKAVYAERVYPTDPEKVLPHID